MKGLITFVMKGRMQAIMVTVVSAILALLITPMAIVSAAIVVLATLRNGTREGLLVALVGVLAIGGLGGFLFQMPIALALMGLTLWLPAWLLAMVLGSSGSLIKALEAAAIGGMLIVAAQYVFMADPAVYWGGLLTEWMQGQFDPAIVSLDEQEKLFKLLAAWMAGGVAATWLVSSVLAVLLGRWASAVLDKPGAFGAEFREIRFSRMWLIAVPAMLLLGVVLTGGEPSFIGQLYLVSVVLFLIQGISVAHSLVAITKAQSSWLFGLYFLLVVGAPHSVTAIAAAGYADGWVDFRARVRARSNRQSGSD